MTKQANTRIRKTSRSALKNQPPGKSDLQGIRVPSGYTGQALPLLVMLHGCTQNLDDFAAGADERTGRRADVPSRFMFTNVRARRWQTISDGSLQSALIPSLPSKRPT